MQEERKNPIVFICLMWYWILSLLVYINRGWDGWKASPIQWTWIWANSGRWWKTRKSGEQQSLGLQRVGHNLEIEQWQNCFIIILEKASYLNLKRFCWPCEMYCISQGTTKIEWLFCFIVIVLQKFSQEMTLSWIYSCSC